MSFGSDLSNQFHMLVGQHFADEVVLFTKLQDAFINLSSGKYHYAIDIIHGATSMVGFQYNTSWISSLTRGSTVTRELSDMMFIVFSNRKNQIRLMYMQNKKGQTLCKFKAELLQLHLLKNRCEITSPTLPSCVFGDRRILRDALLPSVASYGVFFEDNSTIDMAYYPASNINLSTKIGKCPQRIAKFNPQKFGVIKATGFYDESQGEADLTHFADALIRMEIGTPIQPGSKAYATIVGVLYEKSSSFRQTDLIQNTNLQIDNFNLQYQDLPLTYIINADIVQNVSECVNPE